MAVAGPDKERSLTLEDGDESKVLSRAGVDVVGAAVRVVDAVADTVCEDLNGKQRKKREQGPECRHCNTSKTQDQEIT
jgi:hypothetical protein